MKTSEDVAWLPAKARGPTLRGLEDLDLLGLSLDGVAGAGHAVVIVLGVTRWGAPG